MCLNNEEYLMSFPEIESAYYQQFERYIEAACIGFYRDAEPSYEERLHFIQTVPEDLQKNGTQLVQVVTGMVMGVLPMPMILRLYEMESQMDIDNIYKTVVQRMKNPEVH
jgi:hypothetical protein